MYDILYIDEKNSCRIMRGGFYETKKYKVYSLVLLCVAGCMFVAACGQDKGSAVRNDEGSVLSGETEAKDVEKKYRSCRL